MLKSKACWAAGIANVGHAWGFYTLLTELPTFMDNILHFNMKQVGLFKSILCSTVADILISKQIFRVTTVRKIFNSLGRLNLKLKLAHKHVKYLISLQQVNMAPV